MSDSNAVGRSDAPAPTAGTPGYRGKPFATIALEVALISVGVFLALLGDQWRENVQHRKLAMESIRHFHAEFEKNRDAVEWLNLDLGVIQF